jgi:hypothetical protein
MALAFMTARKSCGNHLAIIKIVSGVAAAPPGGGCTRKRSLRFAGSPLGNTRLGALALIRDRSRVHPPHCQRRTVSSSRDAAKDHRPLAEVCGACLEAGDIGLCYGASRFASISLAGAVLGTSMSALMRLYGCSKRTR